MKKLLISLTLMLPLLAQAQIFTWENDMPRDIKIHLTLNNCMDYDGSKAVYDVIIPAAPRGTKLGDGNKYVIYTSIRKTSDGCGLRPHQFDFNVYYMSANGEKFLGTTNYYSDCSACTKHISVTWDNNGENAYIQNVAILSHDGSDDNVYAIVPSHFDRSDDKIPWGSYGDDYYTWRPPVPPLSHSRLLDDHSSQDSLTK